MLIHKTQLQVAVLATTDDNTRYAFNHLLVEPDGRVVSTDGHMLLAVQQTTREADADFPSHALYPAYSGDPTVGVLLSTANAKRLLDGMPKKTTIPVLQTAQVGVNGDGSPYAVSTDLDVPVQVPVQVNGGPNAPQFPAYARLLVPADRPHRTVVLAGEILMRLAKVAKLLAGAHQATGGVVTLEIPTEDTHYFDKGAGSLSSGIRVRLGNTTITVEGVVMPCRA